MIRSAEATGTEFCRAVATTETILVQMGLGLWREIVVFVGHATAIVWSCGHSLHNTATLRIGTAEHLIVRFNGQSHRPHEELLKHLLIQCTPKSPLGNKGLAGWLGTGNLYALGILHGLESVLVNARNAIDVATLQIKHLLRAVRMKDNSTEPTEIL